MFFLLNKKVIFQTDFFVRVSSVAGAGQSWESTDMKVHNSCIIKLQKTEFVFLVTLKTVNQLMAVIRIEFEIVTLTKKSFVPTEIWILKVNACSLSVHRNAALPAWLK